MPRSPSRSRRRTVNTSVTRAIGYVRVSTDKQAESGLSLDAQRERLVAWAALYGVELVEVVVDAGASAKTLDRPGLQRVLAMLAAGNADAILVAKLDRLTRSVRDLGELVDEHFAPGRSALLSVAEQIDTRSAGGRLVLNVLASVAQWEREAIGERTAAAMGVKRARGEFTGGAAPYGYALGGDGITLAPVANEQRVIDVARQLREGGLSLRAVAERLHATGARSRTGRPFAATQVARMLDAA